MSQVRFLAKLLSILGILMTHDKLAMTLCILALIVSFVVMANTKKR